VKNGGRRGRPPVVGAFYTIFTGIYNFKMEKDPFEQRVDRRVLNFGDSFGGARLGPLPLRSKIRGDAPAP